jgi:aspartate/methionine/tyrosine aminotransferase
MKQSFDLAYEYLTARHPTLHILKPNSTPYMMMKLESVIPAQAGIQSNSDWEFCLKAARLGVITVPGKAFGGNCQGWVRINFALEKAELEKGLKILSQALDLV